MRLIQLLTILVLLMVTFLNAQGFLLENNKSGLAVEGVIASASDPDLLGMGVNVGYTPNGWLDFGFGYARSAVSNVYGNSFSPSIGVNLFKNEIVSLTTDVWYAYTSYNSDSFWDNLELNGNSFGFGGTIYKIVNISEKFRIIPAIGIGHSTESLSSNNDDISGETASLTHYDFNLLFAFKTKSGRHIYLGPEISIDDHDNSTFIFGIGIIIPDDIVSKK